MSSETAAATIPVMNFDQLDAKVAEAMERLQVPGVSLGLLIDGQEHVAPFGVTNVDYPSPVLPDTLFQIGSTTKTFTATAIMRLVEAGKIDLDAPVRTYVPELKLADPSVAETVTVRQLLNHTAGWSGDYFPDMGRGDDALARAVESMESLEQLTPPKEMWSYNNAAFYLAGRVIECVAGQPYETALRELVLDPLGLSQTVFFPEEAMLRSFAVGHNVDGDSVTVATPWPIPRDCNPAGGIASSAVDQLRYARFHMGDGTAEDGTRVLSAESLKLMQTPTVEADEGRYVGLSWFISDIDGNRTVAHGGGTIGQLSSFMFVPEHGFALTILTNSVTGGQLHGEIGTWVLREYLGLETPEPVGYERPAEQLAEFAGKYVGSALDLELTLKDGRLFLGVTIKDYPGDSPPPAPPPAPVAFYDDDRFLVEEGSMKGTRGAFLRGPDGTLTWLRFGGRVYRAETKKEKAG